MWLEWNGLDSVVSRVEMEAANMIPDWRVRDDGVLELRLGSHVPVTLTPPAADSPSESVNARPDLNLPPESNDSPASGLPLFATAGLALWLEAVASPDLNSDSELTAFPLPDVRPSIPDGK